MDYITEFCNYLFSQIPAPSSFTVRNYRADIKQFAAWYEKEFNKSFNPALITKNILDLYSQNSPLSARSIDRHFSSLRKFFKFLKSAQIVAFDPTLTQQTTLEKDSSDPWHIKKFKDHLYINNKSNLTIKNYIMDVKQFLYWAEATTGVKDTWNINDRNIFARISNQLIEEYKNRLLHYVPGKYGKVGITAQSINRKLSSLRTFLSWATQNNILNPEIRFDIQNEKEESITETTSLVDQTTNNVDTSESKYYSSFPPTRLFQKLTKAGSLIFEYAVVIPIDSTIDTLSSIIWKMKGKPLFSPNQPEHYTPAKFYFQNIPTDFYAPAAAPSGFSNKLLYHIRNTRPEWYKKYHSYAIMHYFHFAILIIFTSVISFGLYKNFFSEPMSQKELFASPAAPSRFLSFQGKLSDISNNPITTSKNIRFSLYNDKAASGPAKLWEEISNITPDTQGVFSTLLGKVQSIPQSVFSDNPQLWLGITVGNDQELVPRQQLTNVSSSTNAELLQGLPPLTQPGAGTKNVILALDSSGNLSIGPNANPTFQATGGEFKLSGQPLTLTTNAGSNGNVQIAPDGLGKIDLQKPLYNSTTHNNPGATVGSLEIDDMVSILATSSSQSALAINQYSTGSLFTASASGTPRFTLTNAGDGLFSGNVGIGGANGSYKLDITTTIASDRGINISHTATTGTNYGLYSSVSGAATLNVGGYFNATSSATARGIEIASMSSSDSTGLFINSMSATSSATGINVGSLSGSGNGTGIAMGAISTTGSTNYGINLDTLTGGSSKNYQINTGTVTAVASATNIQLNLGGITGTAGSSTNYGMSTGAISSTGTINAAINIGAVSGATNNYSIYSTSTAQSYFAGNVGIGDTAPGNTLKVNGSLCVKSAQGTCAGTTSGTIYATNTTVASADLAENYISSQILEPGDVVIPSNDIHNMAVIKSTRSYQASVVGIVSTKPGVTLNSEAATDSAHPNLYPVGLAGRVPVKVNLENGPIAKGDYLTSSSTPGVAMKATRAGVTIGKALEVFDPAQGGQGRVLAFVNVSWYDPSLQTAFNLPESTSQILSSAVNILKIGTIATLELTTQTFSATTAKIQSLGAQSIEAEKIKSPIAEINIVKTNIISPLSEVSDISIALKDSKFEIRNSRNASGSAVVTIDNTGTATFSGTLTSQKTISNDLDIKNEASIGGTLRAKRIIAEQIEGLQEQITNRINESSSSAHLTPINIASYSAQLVQIDNLSSTFGKFTEGLVSLGSASFTDASVARQLYIGSTASGLRLADNSINVLAGNVEIQPLRQGGISFLSGLVFIDTDGNLSVTGNASFDKDLTIKGKLAVNVISPIPGSDLVVQNASGSAVVSINHLGSIVASGSATVSKLNVSLAEPALALSANEVLATGSAGIATMSAQQSELTIKNSLVTDKSLIYITPLTDTNNLVLYLLRQVPGVSFTIGVNQLIQKNIPFNWIIIN